jgi:MFS family permease
MQRIVFISLLESSRQFDENYFDHQAGRGTQSKVRDDNTLHSGRRMISTTQVSIAGRRCVLYSQAGVSLCRLTGANHPEHTIIESQMPLLSRRWQTIFFLASGVVVNYCLRVNISVAVQDMKDELNWSEYDKGLVLSAFYWGYATGQIPATLIATKIGAKWTFAFAILGSGLVSLLVPSAAKASFGLILLARACVGLCSAFLFPSAYHFFPKWIPLAEKTMMVAVVGAGLYMGEIIAFGASGYLVGSNPDIRVGNLQFGGWPLAFYLFSFLAFAWFPFYAFNVFGSPEEDPYITPEEILLIRKGPSHPSSLSLLSSPDPLSGKDEMALLDNKNLITSVPKGSVGSFDNWEKERLIGPKTSDPNPSSSDARQLSSASSRSVSVADAVLPREMVSPDSTHDGHTTHDDFSAIPWRTIFTHPVSLTLLMMSFTYNWTLFMLLSEIPSFLTDALGFDLEESGLLSVVPYFTNFCSVLLFAQVFENLQVLLSPLPIPLLPVSLSLSLCHPPHCL